MKIFVVSSDVFEGYAHRKDNLEKYQLQGIPYDLRCYISDSICLMEDTIPRRIFIDIPSFYELKYVNIETFGKVIIVEDFELPKLTALHYKDYIFRKKR